MHLIPRALPPNYESLPWRLKRHYKRMWEDDVRALEAWERAQWEAKRVQEIQAVKAEKEKRRVERQQAM